MQKIIRCRYKVLSIFLVIRLGGNSKKTMCLYFANLLEHTFFPLHYVLKFKFDVCYNTYQSIDLIN